MEEGESSMSDSYDMYEPPASKLHPVAKVVWILILVGLLAWAALS
jgi:hypothetical protein